MHFQWRLPTRRARQLADYYRAFPDEGSLELSEYWNEHRRSARIRMEGDTAVIDGRIRDSRVAQGFDDDFPAAHRLASNLSVGQRLVQAKRKCFELLAALTHSKFHREIRVFGEIWDQVETALHADELRRESRNLSWVKIKSYNYFNELFPLIQQLSLDTTERTLLEIGAGSCYLMGHLKARMPKCRCFVIDLPSTIPFGFLHLQSLFPDATFLLPHAITPETTLVHGAADFVFLTPDQGRLIPDNSIDIACNTDSFMEMMPDVISGYFGLLRRVMKPDNVFYCTNRAEKRMFARTSETRTILGGNPNVVREAVPVRFHEYPWEPNDRDFFCYESDFYRRCGFATFFVRATCLAKIRADSRSGVKPSP